MANSPLDYTGIAFWLPTAFGQAMWREAADGQIANAVTTNGHSVGIIDEPVGACRVESSATANSPTLSTGGTHSSALKFTTSQRLQIKNSKSAFRFFHIAQLGEVLFWVKFTNATTGSNEVVLDANDLTSGSNSSGVSIYRNATTGVMTGFLTKGTTGTPAVTINGPAITDTNWHLCRVKFKAGSNNCVFYVDGVAGTAGTITGSPPAAGTDTLFDYAIGEKASSQNNRMAAEIGDLIFIDGEIAAGDLTHFSSYNPTFSASALCQQALAAGSSITPNQYTGLYFWKRYTDANYVTKDAAAANVAGSTLVTANNDKVHGVKNLKTVYTGSHWSRDAVQTGADGISPTWKTNIVNSLPAVVWAGNATDPATDNYANEQNLQYDQWPYGAKTWIVAYQNTDSTNGSHLARAANAGYMVQTGSDYTGGTPPRGDFVCHSNSGVFQTAIVPSPQGVNILVYRQRGPVAQAAINGVWGPLQSGMDNLICVHTGRPKNPLFDLKGSVFEEVLVNAWVPDAPIENIVRPLVSRYGLTYAFASRGSSRIRLGLGLGL